MHYERFKKKASRELENCLRVINLVDRTTVRTIVPTALNYCRQPTADVLENNLLYS